MKKIFPQTCVMLLLFTASVVYWSCKKENTYPLAIEHTLISTISVSPDGSIPLLIGRDTLLTVVYTPEQVTNATLRWYSSDEKIAKVDQSGRVTAVAVGEATITVETEDGGLKRAQTKIQAIDKIIYTESLNLSPTELALFLGETQKVNVVFSPENTTYKYMSWTSADPEVATVDAEGNVKAIAVGQTEVIARALDGSGVSATLYVEVRKPIVIEDIIVAGVVTEVLGEGETHLIDFEVLPAEASKQLVKWSSSNASVVQVSDEGKLVTVGYGEAQLTATAADEGALSRTFVVRVEEGKINDVFRDGVPHRWTTPTAGASLKVENDLLWVTMNGDPAQPNPPANRRGDFRRANTKVHIGQYPIVAFKFVRPLPTAGNIFLDTNLGRWRQTTANGNNQMTRVMAKDGVPVFYANLSEYNSFGQSSNLQSIPENQLFQFGHITVGVADFPNAQSPISPFEVHWVKTFKTVAELEAYINQ